MKPYRHYLGLGLVIVAFLFFTLPGLNARSLWLDEGVTLYNSAGSFGEVTSKVATLDLSPPFYYYVMSIWRDISGLDASQNQALLRFPSIIFAVLSLCLVFLIGRKKFNAQVGIWAAALTAINPFFIGFSQEARMYMLLTCLVLAAYFFLLKILREEKAQMSWIVFTVINILGLYTHNFYWFALASLALTTLCFLPWLQKRMKFLGYGLLSCCFTLLAFLPWLSSFLTQLKTERYWIAPVNWQEIKDFLIDFSGGSKPVFYIITALVLIGFAYLLLIAKKQARKKEFYFNFYFLAVFCLMSFILPLLYSLTIAPLVKVRYLLFLPAFVSILAAIGIYSLRRLQKFLVVIPVIVMLLFWHPWNNLSYPVEMNEDFAYAQDFIPQESSNTPVIIHTPSAAHVYSFYDGGYENLKPFPDSFDLRNYNIDEKNQTDFATIAKEYTDFWLLISHSHENPQGLLRQWSESICPQINEKRLGPIFLVHYRCLD